jgi:hypothetical protein
MFLEAQMSKPVFNSNSFPIALMLVSFALVSVMVAASGILT